MLWPCFLLSPSEKSLEEDEEQGEAEDEVGEVEHGGGEGVDGVPVHVEGKQTGVLQIFERMVHNCHVMPTFFTKQPSAFF